VLCIAATAHAESPSDQAEAGTANRSVFLESEASMLSASADLLRAEYDRSVAAADLARLVGHEVTASVGDKQIVNAPRYREF